MLYFGESFEVELFLFYLSFKPFTSIDLGIHGNVFTVIGRFIQSSSLLEVPYIFRRQLRGHAHMVPTSIVLVA